MAFAHAARCGLQDIIREHVVEQTLHDLVNDVEVTELDLEFFN